MTCLAPSPPWFLFYRFLQVVNHPYMFQEADLNPHETDESIITTSAKMMVLVFPSSASPPSLPSLL